MAARPPVIQFLRGIDSNLPGLRKGEPGFTTDFYNFYVGIDSTTGNNKFLGSHRYWRKESAGVPSQLRLVPGTAGIANQFLALQVPDGGYAGVNTYVFPTLNSGSTNNVLAVTSISNGVYTLSWQPSGSGGGGYITVQEEGSTVGTASSINILNFVGNAITAVANPAPNGIATITVAQASTSQEGTASFTSGDFTVASGVVSIGDTFINRLITDTGAATPSGHALSIVGGEGVDVTHSGATITVAGEYASTTNAGIASFSSDSFTVSPTGLVQINTVVSGGSTFTTINVTGIGTINTLNSTNAQISGILTVTGNTIIGDTGGDTLTVNATTTFNNGITGTISTATRATLVDTTLTTANAEYYPVFVDTNASATGETIRVDSDGLTYNPSTNVLTIPTIDVATIRHTNDTVAITIDTSGNVVSSQNFTVQGNLIVNGNTTQVNTSELQVEDRSITLGIETGGTPSTTTWDLAILMNYGDAGVAKTAGIIWDYSAQRMVISANSNNPASTQGSPNAPIFSISQYAPIEAESLWINDTEGQNGVITYLGANVMYTGQVAGRYLQYTSVDAGEF